MEFPMKRIVLRSALLAGLLVPIYSFSALATDSPSTRIVRAASSAPPTSDLDCRKKAPGPSFNSLHQYTCAYTLFHDLSMPLGDPAKRAEFEKLWAPSVWKNSEFLKMDGLSDKERSDRTFKLIRRMRDFTHERFDFVSDAEEAAEQTKHSEHPTLDGGIGAILLLNNSWQFQKAIFANAPPEGIPSDEFDDKMERMSIIGPGHELVIDVPVRGSPSDHVLQSGDVVEAVENPDTGVVTALAGLTQKEAVSMIRGPIGSRVKLHVLRRSTAGSLIPLTLMLTRDVVEQRAVLVRDADGIRHITLTNFSNDFLLDDFYDAITGAEKAGMKGIDIDVRNDPGGRLAYAKALLEMLVPRGLIVKDIHRDDASQNLSELDTVLEDGYGLSVSTVAGEPDPAIKVPLLKRVPYSLSYARQAARSDAFVDMHPLLPAISADMPITVTVNVNSYSASEVFAGALKATGRATIVGDPTAGKGAIMIRIPLPEGGNVSVTNGEYYPGGLYTKHKGVTPDRLVKQAKDYGETDAQRDAATAVLREQRDTLEKVKALETERTKINDMRFELEMKMRDDHDNQPLPEAQGPNLPGKSAPLPPVRDNTPGSRHK